MSYHVLHVLRHGAIISKSQGFILCRDKDEITGRIALSDIRAVIIAARGVLLSSSVISALLENDAVILHCDSKYQPCGVSAALPRTVNIKAASAQADKTLKVHELLWKKVLKSKVGNQAAVLEKLNSNAAFLRRQADEKLPDESNCARFYWRNYFSASGVAGLNRRQEEESPVNAKLNYGYAVLSALIHRAIIIHGLNPLFGIHHKARPGAAPLVYDLMEPLRPFVDLALYGHLKGGGDQDMKNWCKHIAGEFRNLRVNHERYSVKMIDAIDFFVSSTAKAFRSRSVKHFWLPEL